jgi:predicted RNase H-like HicB family nuclease
MKPPPYCVSVRQHIQPINGSPLVRSAEEGGYWAEVPAIPGTQSETFDELLANLYEAVEGCLSVDVADATLPLHE